ncbi:MAG: class I SAM-dependent methyltransferase [Deltaproteobacteria bacterium]|nr:class I SAM-dependent methyltransferase [Deltaproteobacteria bacterium]
MKVLAVVTPLHLRTKRDYLGRMQDDKVHCMEIAKKFGREFWDGERRYGYGGYTYDGRWAQVARSLLDIYNLPAKAKILDVGCGKGFLLYEFSRLLPEAELHGFDISPYAVSHAKEEIRNRLFVQKAEQAYDFADGYFDLVVSLGTLHNLKVSDLAVALGEVERVGREKYIMVESYRTDAELFNLQCWALTCESFFRPEEWQWLMGIFGYQGDYEFIYFE